MLDFSQVNREYQAARESFSVDIPDHFNFAFDVLDERAKKASKDALIWVDGESGRHTHVTYADLAAGSTQFAKALMALGMKRGDAACVVIGRRPEWHQVLLGCMNAGVISMPGTTLLTAKDIAYRVNQSGAKAIMVSPEHCDKVDQIVAECPTVQHLIVAGATPSDSWLSLAQISDEQNSDSIASCAEPFSSKDTMLIYFTSGTTALPKMVPRDFGYGLAHAATGLFWMDLQESDVHWTLTDTGWAKAAWGMLFPQMLLGVATVLYDAIGMDVDAHLNLIDELKITTFCAPPTVYRLFAQEALSEYSLGSLRRCLGAGEPLNPEVIRYWEEHAGTTIADGYGQTETINIVGNFSDVEPRFGSMGKPVPGFDVDVIDDDGKVLADDEVGHIAVRTDGAWPVGLFHGYLKDGELVTQSFNHGWYYTSDTAYRDKDGYLWFVGRSDDLISSAGYRISPFEVESALLEHDKVVESAVIGIPDETRGQLVKAYIVLTTGTVASDDLADEIQSFCKDLTAPYKYPRVVQFVDSLPKTISGKIRRVELRQDA